MQPVQAFLLRALTHSGGSDLWLAPTHSPCFYSDLFELSCEAAGELDSQLDTVYDWQDDFRKGVVYYLEDKRVRGVLLWNVCDQVDAARNLIARGDAFQPEELLGGLPS